MDRWDEQLRRANRTRRGLALLRPVLAVVGALLIAALATSDDPDRLGPWLVGGLVVLGVAATVIGLRRLR